jgi:hypothetical protein
MNGMHNAYKCLGTCGFVYAIYTNTNLDLIFVHHMKSICDCEVNSNYQMLLQITYVTNAYNANAMQLANRFNKNCINLSGPSLIFILLPELF